METEAPPIKGQTVLLIAAIANPALLREHLLQMGASRVHTMAFRDHHVFTPADMSRLYKEWQTLPRTACAITTQKDAARLIPLLHLIPTDLREKMFVQPITVEVDPADDKQEKFNQTILHYVSQD